MLYRVVLHVVALLVTLPCFAQVPPHLQEFGIPGGVTCQLPVGWRVDVRQIDPIPDAEASRPRVLFSARPLTQVGASGNGEQESFTVSRWSAPPGPAVPVDTSRNPLDLSETFALRQALALEGFTIAKAWTATSEKGGTQVVASTFLGFFAKGFSWVVETTTWRMGNVIYAAQLRYPEQVYLDHSWQEVVEIKKGVSFNALPTPAFASGYVPAVPTSEGAPQPSSVAKSQSATPDLAPQSPFAATPAQPLTAASSPAPTPGTAPPLTRAAERREVLKLIQAVSGSIALVEGKEGAGSAFVCNQGGQKYVFTNTHVLAGLTAIRFRLINRAPLPLGAAATAVNHDATRLAVTSDAVPALELLDNISANVAVGDLVLVLGNANGAQVVNPVVGYVVGIGPERIEVNAPIVPGHSGSPIIHVRSGKVIGIATYLSLREGYTPTGRTKERVTYFGYRLDSVETWQPINWPKFVAEAAAITQAKELTEDMARLLTTLAGNKASVEPARNAALRRAELEYSQASVGSRASQAELSNAKQTFLATLRSLSAGDLASLRPTLTYDYFQRQVSEEQGIRNVFVTAFNEVLNY